VPGPFTVTTQVAGPFQIECESYNLADLAVVVASRGNRSTAHPLAGPYAWIAFLTLAIGTGVVAWLLRGTWPLVTVLLYTLWITIVFLPLTLFLAVVLGGTGYPELHQIGETLGEMYRSGWWFWGFCAIVVISQLLLLALPIRVAKQRPTPQSSIWSTALGAAAFFVLIILGMACSVTAAVLGDDVLETIPFWGVLAFVLYSWVLWAWLFHGFAHSVDAHGYLARLTKWLLRGSILGLLVAVPSHIIVRHKDVCCAHGLTAFGIATGLAVLLISFGPGIYFLYADRIRSKSPRSS